MCMGDNMYDTLKLKELRNKYGYSMKDMSLKLNISVSYYSLIESKKRNLYYDLAIKIAKIFNLKPDDIFYN